MKKNLLFICALFISTSMFGQRYTTPIFSEADIVVQPNVNYGLNYNPYIDSALLGGTNIQPLQADFYMPSPTADTVSDRPVVIVWHTGSFIPKGVNGSPLGTKQDSAVVEMCKRFAMMGYVSVAASYRLGWLANSTNLDLRRGTNLLAVYYSIQDAKALVRYLNITQLGANNPYGINASNTIMVGQGSGGYITFAYATIDDHAEVVNPPKFQYQDTIGMFGGTVSVGDPYVDTSIVGDIDGYGGEVTLTGQNTLGLPTMDYTQSGRNYINHPGMSDDVLMVVNMGGALGDGAWLEQGDVPMLSIHSKYDFFAPYDTGMVYVPIGQQFYPVVSVTGSYGAIKAANTFGNNSIFNNATYTDALWTAQQSTNPTMEKCIYTVEIPPASALQPWVVNTAPWNWYDPSDPFASQNPANPNNDSISRAWVDTVMAYIVPRMATVLQAQGVPAGIDEYTLEMEVYPNPTSGVMNIKTSNHVAMETLTVYDISGRVLLNETALGNRTEIDLSNWKSGVYILKVNTERGAAVRQITVH